MFELDLTRVDYTWQPAGESQSNTFTAAQTFSVSATFSAGLTSTGLAQFTSSSLMVGGITVRSNGTISTTPAGYGSSNLTIHGIAAESSAFPYSMLESTGNNQGHILAFRSSRGTYSARTACLSNDILGQLDFGGFTGAGTTLNGKGVIRCVASENWSTTATGTRLEFFTTANTTLTNTVRLTIQDGGKCVFNSNAINVVTAQTPATSAAAGTAGDIAWDDTYLYVRMSTGWRRIALGAAF
jgi:hypothetical protein